MLALLFFLVAFATAHADVRLPTVIADHMVLQRDREISLWGWADPGENVALELNGKSASTAANNDGRWSAKLPAMDPGGPFTLLVRGKNTQLVNDILIGDVWVCSGQSNMEWMVAHSNDAAKEIANASHPKIRLFSIPNRVAAEPQDDVDAEWQICRPSTIAQFSAVGYYFGRELNKALDVPIGLINSSWGGSAAEPWISADSGDATFQRVAKAWNEPNAPKLPEIVEYYRVMGDWLEDAYHAMSEGVSLPPAAQPLQGVKDVPIFPSGPSLTYNAMIAPITQFGVRGAIWYQGETNAARAYEYRDILKALINDWRRQFNRDDLAFLIVQLANYQKRDEQPGESAWAELREAQAMALELPNTGLACTIDIGDADDIHPRNKQEVGRRLALSCLGMTYRVPAPVYSGPTYKSMLIEGNEIRIVFDLGGYSLASKDNAPLKGFAIAGEDRKFVWADARIDGPYVIVSSKDVAEPVAVRYAWANNPECNLYNAEGLPAVPFRTDDWPGITQPAASN